MAASENLKKIDRHYSSFLTSSMIQTEDKWRKNAHRILQDQIENLRNKLR